MAGFRNDAARTSWCMSRILVRETLSRALDIEPDRIHLETGPYGKPFLKDSEARFNWAHANGCVVLAMANGVEVGCDVEPSAEPYGTACSYQNNALPQKRQHGWLLPGATGGAGAFFPCLCRKKLGSKPEAGGSGGHWWKRPHT